MTPDETRTVPRGRHRRPRHRRALLAAGALTLTAGAATLIHLATPDAPPRDTRAAALPSPEGSGAPTTASEEAASTRITTPPPAPHPSPTSPRAQGGKAQAPLTQRPTPSRTPTAPPSPHTETLPPPRTSPTPEPPPEQQPTAPPPATTPAPPPPPPDDDENEDDNDDRGLCLPLLNICLGG
ncbi:hypothetical protein LUX34_12780 [Streptomyces werraensis]|nr:hypothetical protein [Streptomyces werraensis]